MTSTRRAARAAALSGEVHIKGQGVPAELLNVYDPVWKSDAAARRWHARHGLKDPPDAAGLYWPRRHQNAVTSWAESRGLLDKWGRPDPPKMRALGIPASTSARCRLGFDANGDVYEVKERTTP